MNESHSARILVVEDEDAIRTGLGDALRFQGYRSELVADGARGLERALAGGFDCLLLDVMLPEVDGFTICRRVREAIPGQAICMLTAKGREEDILEGFACGADDYIAKPFSVRQLLARIAALLRRSLPAGVGGFHAGGVAVDADALRASHDGAHADLSRRDVAVLALLAKRTGSVVSRQDLLQEVWGYGRLDGVETRCVDMHLVKLRRKLKQGLGLVGHRLIETVRGEGYRLREG